MMDAGKKAAVLTLILCAAAGEAAAAYPSCRDARESASKAGKAALKRLDSVCSKIVKKDPAAPEALDEILKEHPRLSAGFLHRAVARRRSGDAAGASADYRESLKTPESAEAAAGACLCSAKLAEDAEALAQIHAKVEAAKKEGVALFLDGKIEKALARFNAAVELDPNDPEARMSRAVAIEKLGGDKAKALADYQIASRYALASGRWDMAADAFLSSAKLGPESKEVLPGAVFGLQEVIESAGKDWKRRGAVSSELKSLKAKMEKVIPKDSLGKKDAQAEDAPGTPENKEFDGNLLPNDPRPDGEDKGQPDMREKVDPDAKKEEQAVPKFAPPPGNH